MADTVVERLIVKLDAETSGFSDRMDDAQQKLANLAQFATSGPMALAALGAAFVSVAAAATTMAAQVDQATRKLRAALPNTNADLTGLKKAVRDLSLETPVAQDALMNLGAEIAGMGTTAPDEIAKHLKTLTLVADALGATDLSGLAGQLDLLGDAFSLTGEEARQAFVQIAAMAKGRIDIAELGAVLGKIAVPLKAMKVSAQDAAAAITTLIDAGLDKRKISSGLVDLLDRAGKASDAAIDAEAAKKEGTAKSLRVLADVLSTANVRAKGLNGALAELYARLDRNKEVFIKAGLSVEQFAIAEKAAEVAANGAGNAVKSYAEAVAEIGAAAEVNRGSAQALAAILKNELGAVMTDLGNMILPTVIQTLDGLSLMFSKTRREARFFAKAMTETAAELKKIREEEEKSGQKKQYAPGAAIDMLDKRVPQLLKSPVLVEGMGVKELQQLKQNIREAVDMLEGRGLTTKRWEEAHFVIGMVNERLKELVPAAKRVSPEMEAATKALDALDTKLAGKNGPRGDAAQKMVAAWKRQAEEAGLAADEVASGMERLNATLDGHKWDDTGTAAAAAAEKLDELRRSSDEMIASWRGMSEAEKGTRDIEVKAEEFRKAGMGAKELMERVDAMKAALAQNLAGKAAQEMAEYAKELAEAAQNRAELAEGIQKEDRAKQAANAAAALELDKLRLTGQELVKGISVRKEVLALREKERAAAIAAAEAEAIAKSNYAKVGMDPRNDPEVIAAKQAAEALFDARNNVEDIRAALQEIADGDIATKLGEVAGQFTQIATSLGKAGESLGRVVGILGPALTGLGSVMQSMKKVKLDGAGNVMRDASGNALTESVGYFDALKGKAGSGNQAKAIAGTFAIVGAVAQVADALDLFGNRARERARQVKEAAQAFDKALQDFVRAAMPDSGATAAIRVAQEQAAEMAKSARDMMNHTKLFTEHFPMYAQSLAKLGSTATSGDLRRISDEFALMAKNSTGKTSKEAAELSRRFLELADALALNEAAARKQVLANLEDLGVRRLQAAGLTAQAEQLRREIAGRRELETASRDTTTEGKAYYEALKLIIAAEAAAAEAATRRAAIQQRLDDDNALLGGTDAEKLQRKFTALGAMFGDFAGVFDEFDLTTKGGLEGAKAKIRSLYEGMAADGIDEIERPIIDFLKALYGDLDAAIGALPEVLDPMVQALEAFDERVGIFALSVAEQLTALGGIFAGQFDGVLDDLIAGADLTTEAGRTAFSDALKAMANDILSDGKITEEERPLFNAIQRLLGIVATAAEDATRTAEQAAADAEEARTKSLGTRARNASLDVALGDLEGPEAFAATVRGYSAAFAALFDEFDVSTLAGIDGARDAILTLRASLDSMTDEEVLAKFGMTRDEVLDAIMSLDGGLDGLKDTMEAAADAARDFTGDLTNEWLEATGNGVQAELNRIDEWVADQFRRAEELGVLTDGVRQQILAVGAARKADVLKRVEADAARDAEQAAKDAAVDPTKPTAETFKSVVGSSVTTISEGTAIRITEFLASSLIEQRTMRVTLEQVAALLGAVLGGGVIPALSAPALPPGVSAGAFGAVPPITVIVNVAGPISGMTPQDAGSQIAAALVPALNFALGRAAGIDRRNAGVM